MRIFPKVWFIEATERPSTIEEDRNGKLLVVNFERTDKPEELLGLQIDDNLFIYPQSAFGKVITILHEYCHWLNTHIGNKTHPILEWYGDQLIEKVL